MLRGIALKRVMDSEGMDLEIIINPKAMGDGQAVIQVPILSRRRPLPIPDSQFAVRDGCRSSH